MKQLIFFTLLMITASSLYANEVLYEQNFNGPAKPYLKRKHITLAKNAGPDGSDAIKVTYEGYHRGSHRVGGTYPLSKGVTEATLTFDVKFDKDFQWVKGGKLHGLAPQNAIGGGKKRRKDGWSARMMFKTRGKLGYYIYDQNPKLKYGVEKYGSIRFKKNVWHTVTYKIKLNDPKKKNGYVYVAIDGKRVISAKNIKFRSVDGPATLISRFSFSTFHGGHMPEWAPKAKNGKGYANVYAYFDNFKVIQGIE